MLFFTVPRAKRTGKDRQRASGEVPSLSKSPKAPIRAPSRRCGSAPNSLGS